MASLAPRRVRSMRTTCSFPGFVYQILFEERCWLSGYQSYHIVFGISHHGWRTQDHREQPIPAEVEKICEAASITLTLGFVESGISTGCRQAARLMEHLVKLD